VLGVVKVAGLALPLEPLGVAAPELVLDSLDLLLGHAEMSKCVAPHQNGCFEYLPVGAGKVDAVERDQLATSPPSGSGILPTAIFIASTSNNGLYLLVHSLPPFYGKLTKKGVSRYVDTGGPEASGQPAVPSP